MNFRRLYAQTVFYPTLWWNYLLGRVLGLRRWWDRVDDHIILGARPFPTDVAKLDALGVAAVVNTCEEYDGPIEQYDRHGIKQLHIPTTDFTHPHIDDVRRAVDFMDDYIRQDKTVYVHCKAGRARSATVVMAYLMMHRAMSADQAQRHLLSKRSHVNPRLTERPVIQEIARTIQTGV